MKITESYLRKIIRGTLNEMFSGADPTPSFHDAPPEEPASEMAGKSSAEIADYILHQYQVGGQVDANLMSLLDQIVQNEKYGPPAQEGPPLGMMGETKKRK
jgi:hypothetical protein